MPARRAALAGQPDGLGERLGDLLDHRGQHRRGQRVDRRLRGDGHLADPACDVVLPEGPVQDVQRHLEPLLLGDEEEVGVVDGDVHAGPVGVGAHAEPDVLQVELVVAQDEVLREHLRVGLPRGMEAPPARGGAGRRGPRPALGRAPAARDRPRRSRSGRAPGPRRRRSPTAARDGSCGRAGTAPRSPPPTVPRPVSRARAGRARRPATPRSSGGPAPTTPRTR